MDRYAMLSSMSFPATQALESNQRRVSIDSCISSGSGTRGTNAGMDLNTLFYRIVAVAEPFHCSFPTIEWTDAMDDIDDDSGGDDDDDDDTAENCVEKVPPRTCGKAVDKSSRRDMHRMVRSKSQYQGLSCLGETRLTPIPLSRWIVTSVFFFFLPYFPMRPNIEHTQILEHTEQNKYSFFNILHVK